MNHLRHIVCLLLIFAFVLPSTNAQAFHLSGAGRLAVAQEGTCNCAKLPDKVDKNEIWIDASTGKVTGRSQFSLQDKVKVIVYNLNPFYYSYELEINSEKISEQALNPFLTFLGKPVIETLPAATQSFSLSLPVGDPNCPGGNVVKSKLTSIEADISEALKIRSALNNDIDVVLQKYKDEKSKFDAAWKKLQDIAAQCEDLCTTSNTLLEGLSAALKNLTKKELDDLQKALNTLSENSQSALDETKKIRDTYSVCANLTEVKNPLEKAEPLAKGLQSYAQEFAKTLQSLVTFRQGFEQLQDKVKKVRKPSAPFQMEKWVGGFESSMKTTIKLKRKPVEDKGEEETRVTHEIKHGDAPFFTLSGGVVFSTLVRRDFGKIQGFARDRNGVLVPGQTTPTNIIDLKEESNTRISPLVMLSGRIWPIRTANWLHADGVHFSFAVTAKNDGQNTNIEYLIGPSVSFLERQLFLTCGGYAGKQQKLAGGLYIGQAVAESTAITIQNNYRWSFGAAVTYKIK